MDFLFFAWWVFFTGKVGEIYLRGRGEGREIEKVKEAVVGVSKKKRWGWPGGREGGRREGKGSKRRWNPEIGPTKKEGQLTRNANKTQETQQE